MRLLTRVEYNNTLRDLLGDTSAPANDFPREPLAQGFDNDGNANVASDEYIARALDAAEKVAHDAVTARPETLFVCTTQDDSCREGFLSGFGRRAFRRRLTADELTGFRTLFNQARTQTGSFTDAVEWTLTAMLQSPQFLYRFEEGTGPSTDSWRVPLTGDELASRLSYFLWASMPDDALLNAAEAGRLGQPDTLRAEVQRMLADNKGKAGLRRFFDLLVRADEISAAGKDTATYPLFTQDLPALWQKSLALFLDEQVAGTRSLNDVLTSKVMYVNNAMSMYAQGPASGVFQRVEMPAGAGQRTGVLTQPGFLARLASPNQSSPVRRGIFVLEKLMCQPPNPPPANFAPMPPEVSPTATTRERFAAHSQNAACASCHASIDPIGFSFENYDGMGVWRDTENGKPVDATGSVIFLRDTTLSGATTGPGDLVDRLAHSAQVRQCVAEGMVRFALGRELGGSDACSVKQISADFNAAEGAFDALVHSLVASDSFRTRPVETAP